MLHQIDFVLRGSSAAVARLRGRGDHSPQTGSRAATSSRSWRIPPAIPILILGAAVYTLGNPSLHGSFPERTRSWPLTSSGKAAPQGFRVRLGEPPAPGETFGMVGGGGYYLGEITLTPSFEIPGDGTIRIDVAATRHDLQRHDPGGLAAISWGIDMMDFDNPANEISKIIAVFDTGTATASGPPGYSLAIPQGAHRLLEIDIEWAWQDNKQSLTFRHSNQL